MPSQYEDKELRAAINKIYNEAVMMGRLRTGSPITHVEDSIMQLITQKQLEAYMSGNINGFYAAMGMSGVEIAKVPELYDRYQAELTKQKGK